jgi:hypothetical protein
MFYYTDFIGILQKIERIFTKGSVSYGMQGGVFQTTPTG